MDIPDTSITTNAQETSKLGREIGRKLGGAHPGSEWAIARTPPGCAVCLFGELGSGKTTFVQGFAKGLGITSRLLSPTFIIVRRYQIPDSSGFLYHLDLYRVEEGKLDQLGLSDIFSDPDSFVVIEWAEKLGSSLPSRRIDVHFSVLVGGNHELRFEKSY